MIIFLKDFLWHSVLLVFLFQLIAFPLIFSDFVADHHPGGEGGWGRILILRMPLPRMIRSREATARVPPPGPSIRPAAAAGSEGLWPLQRDLEAANGTDRRRISNRAEARPGVPSRFCLVNGSLPVPVHSSKKLEILRN